MEEEIKNPLFEALRAITGEKPPEFVRGKFATTDLNDRENDKLQEWCLNNARPHWSTGIGIMEAADTIVIEAIGNCNICGR
jgi:hypothetical protein